MKQAFDPVIWDNWLCSDSVWAKNIHVENTSSEWRPTPTREKNQDAMSLRHKCCLTPMHTQTPSENHNALPSHQKQRSSWNPRCGSKLWHAQFQVGNLAACKENLVFVRSGEAALRLGHCRRHHFRRRWMPPSVKLENSLHLLFLCRCETSRRGTFKGKRVCGRPNTHCMSGSREIHLSQYNPHLTPNSAQANPITFHAQGSWGCSPPARGRGFPSPQSRPGPAPAPLSPQLDPDGAGAARDTRPSRDKIK